MERKKGRPTAGTALLSKCRRRPTLPGPFGPSTIGAGGLNFRVRNGNGWFPAAITTGTPVSTRLLEHSIANTYAVLDSSPSPRPISTGRLNTLPCLHLRPINVVVWPRALLR